VHYPFEVRIQWNKIKEMFYTTLLCLAL
jgi:hypothetical protein